jgi:hypothetical protein
MRIMEILENLDGNEITIRGLKMKDPGFFRALPRSTFQRARDEAIEGTEWSLQGATLVKVKTEPEIVEAEAMKMPPRSRRECKPNEVSQESVHSHIL